MGKQQRSPKYPFIALEKAIWRAQQFYEAEGKNSASMPVAMKAWEYSPKSSGGLQTIGALVGYNLLEDEGSGDSRRLKLSDLALSILLDKRPGSKDRDNRIKEAFLSPKIFRELWEECKIYGIPSDANLQHTLVFEKNFPEKSVSDFIKIFRQNIEFSRVSFNEDQDSPSPESEEEALEERIDDTSLPRSGIIGTQAKAVGGTMKQDTLDLDEGVAVLQWPANISMNSYAEIQDWLEFQLKRMKSRAKKTSSDGAKDDEGIE